MLTSAQALPAYSEPEVDGPASCTVPPTMMTTEGRMTRAGFHEREREAHRIAIGRTHRDVSPHAGMAVRRSVEVFAELRRVLGSDAPSRA